jgi:hypothetical protein
MQVLGVLRRYCALVCGDGGGLGKEAQKCTRAHRNGGGGGDKVGGGGGEGEGGALGVAGTGDARSAGSCRPDDGSDWPLKRPKLDA